MEPQDLMTQLVDMAFSMFNYWDLHEDKTKTAEKNTGQNYGCCNWQCFKHTQVIQRKTQGQLKTVRKSDTGHTISQATNVPDSWRWSHFQRRAKPAKILTPCSAKQGWKGTSQLAMPLFTDIFVYCTKPWMTLDVMGKQFQFFFNFLLWRTLL